MSDFHNSRPPNNAEFIEKAIDLIEGRGSYITRKLTWGVIRAFPSTVNKVPSEYQQRLRDLISKPKFDDI
ncbi:hypothetical protein [Pantanalinema sp. GBBB05]|uniref:hypothetical protein n=1 Tax=Pantanalinema sp. GBBB05 TaxID=2604139 RepID=UPI001DC7BA1A|nr:hypothetical protein [Pantanalinema sp. GBBB05]